MTREITHMKAFAAGSSPDRADEARHWIAEMVARLTAFLKHVLEPEDWLVRDHKGAPGLSLDNSFGDQLTV